MSIRAQALQEAVIMIPGDSFVRVFHNFHGSLSSVQPVCLVENKKIFKIIWHHNCMIPGGGIELHEWRKVNS
jgi:hypothetical protein